jgi:hypothetical protein
MCRAYLIKPNAGWERHHAPELEAAHSAALPSMICDRCGAWALTGIQYPSIDVIALQREFGRLEPSAVSLAEFSTLKLRVAHFFAPEQEILPGAGLGPIIGKARGVFGDFAWLNPWTVLVRESVVKKLQLAHIPVVAIKRQA